MRKVGAPAQSSSAAQQQPPLIVRAHHALTPTPGTPRTGRHSLRAFTHCGARVEEEEEGGGGGRRRRRRTEEEEEGGRRRRKKEDGGGQLRDAAFAGGAGRAAQRRPCERRRPEFKTGTPEVLEIVGSLLPQIAVRNDAQRQAGRPFLALPGSSRHCLTSGVTRYTYIYYIYYIARWSPTHTFSPLPAAMAPRSRRHRVSCAQKYIG
eukprot:SAG31_NODE_37_length_31616_cov_38.688359_12_plen_207_part_00